MTRQTNLFRSGIISLIASLSIQTLLFTTDIWDMTLNNRNALNCIGCNVKYTKNCNILCFTDSWLNDDIKNIRLADYTLYRRGEAGRGL